MGVVKNLMVRVGADVRGVVQGMKSASSATKKTKDSIQDSTGSIKKSIQSGFDGSRMSIRQYTQAVRQTRTSHKMAQAEARQLKDQLSNMKSTWNAASAALSGLNPARSLNEQVAEAEEALMKIGRRRRELEKATAGATAKQQGSASYKKQLHELQNLNFQYRLTTAGLDVLKNKMSQLSKVKGFDANVSLDQMRQKINQTEAQLNSAQMAATKTGEKLKSMGSGKGFAIGRILRGAGSAVATVGRTAAKVAGAELKLLWQGLKKVGSVVLSGAISAVKHIGSAAMKAYSSGVRLLGNGLKSLAAGSVRSIGAISGKLLGIGKSAQSGTGGLKNMVRQIRNMGAVSLGLRVVSGTFGRLRSIISSYISSNEELNASVSMLKNQLGQALEPAIRLVIAAMQKLTPIAQQAANAVNAVLKSVLGDVGDVQYAFRNLGTYGFDQITKADNEEEDTGTEQEQSALVQKLTGWIEELKAAFTAGDWAKLGNVLGDGINSAFAAIDVSAVGQKVADIVNNVATTIGSAFETLDIGGFGAGLAQSIATALTGIDVETLGQTIGQVFTALPEMAVGFITGADWSAVTAAVSGCITSALSAVTGWVQGVNWQSVGDSITAGVAGVDWSGIASGITQLLGATAGALDFGQIGETISVALGGILNGANWENLGQTLANILLALPQTLTGVAQGLDWSAMASAVSGALHGALEGAASWITESDWVKIGQGVQTFIRETDWGGIASDLFDLLHDAITGVDYTAVGASVAGILNDVLQQTDWTQLGVTVGTVLLALPQAVIGFALEADWASVGSALSETLKTMLYTATNWVRETDWVQVGQSVLAFVEGFDWGGVASALFGLVNAAFGGTDYSGIGTDLTGKLSNAVGSIQWGQMGTMVASGLNDILALINTGITGFDWPGAAAGLATELNALVSGFDWGGLGTTLSNACVVLLQTIRSAITTFDWVGLGAGIADGVNNIDFVQILSDLAGSVSDILVGALDIVLGFAEELDWAKLGRDVWNGLCGIITSIDWNGIISRAFELVGAAIAGAVSLVAGLFTAIWDSLVSGWESVKDYWTGQVEDAGGNIWQGVLNGITDGLTNIGNWILTNIWEPFKKGFCEAFGIHSPSTKAKGWGGNIITGLLNGLLGGFNGIGGWIKTNLWEPFRKAFENTFSGLGDKMEDIFKGIKNVIKTPINGIIGFINSMVSAVCSGVNLMIDALNAINVEIPDWGIFGDLRGKKFGFNIGRITAPKIPMLAKGGIVTEPTTAIIGEQGKKEAVLPLEQNTGWMDKMADKVSTRVSGGAAGNQPMIVQVFLGKRKLTEYVIQDINQITKSTGVCPIKV